MTDKEIIKITKGFKKGLALGDRMMCYAVSAPLQGFLSACGLNCKLINPTVKNGSELWDHYCIELEDGRILDPTASQFDHLNLPEIYLGVMPGSFTKDCDMTVRLTVEEFRKMKVSKKSKYRNNKVELHGELFDSKKEARRYGLLILMVAHGEIFDLCRQVKFELIPAQYAMLNGKRTCIEKSCSYYADFTYKDKDLNYIVEDSKGMKTTDYIIKKKLMLHVHGIQIKEV